MLLARHLSHVAAAVGLFGTLFAAPELSAAEPALRAGIALVYQDRSLFGPLSVAENIFAGRQPVTRLRRIDYRRLNDESRRLLLEVGLEPTRGVDVGAKAEIHQLLYEQARRGKAIVVILSDLLELLAVSDRVLVMCEGRITGELTRAEATEAKIVELASRFRQPNSTSAAG